MKADVRRALEALRDNCIELLAEGQEGTCQTCTHREDETVFPSLCLTCGRLEGLTNNWAPKQGEKA